MIKNKTPWDRLSLAEQAEMMKVAVKNGIYNLHDIRNKYNEFAEGGEVANEIPMDYQPLVSNTYQPIVDALKTDNTGFNIDDYTYRVQKLHPEITRDQVQSLYNATPYIASDKVIGTREGGFRPGDETGYGRRVTLYPNTYTQDTGTKVTSSNANETMGDTLAHETNHLYTDVLLGGTNDAEGDLLWEAYRPGLVVQDSGFNGKFSEERAINAGIRNRISRENGNVIGEELDKAIDNTPDDVLMNMLFDPNNGYINQNGKKHMQDSNGNWNRTGAVRKALKDVAMNIQAQPSNYAAFGGPLVQAANEYRHGGNTVREFVNALYDNNPREEYLGEPSHHYDFTQSEEWANAHGYYPDARGHRDDRVKKPAHPSHPSRGTWDGDKFILTDLGIQDPNYTMFGLVDRGQDPQAILTYKGGVVLPEITVTPQGNYFFNPYDNIELHTKAHGGSIHIKPSHRGRLTELKKRTGKSEAELYRTGGPAVRKMITFARNARKWKHGLGGSLFYDSDEENIYGFGDWITKAYNKAKSAVRKGRKIVKDLGLDKTPDEHLIEYFAKKEERPKTKNLDAVLQHKKENNVKGRSWYFDPTTNTGYRLEGDSIADKFEIISGLDTSSDGYTPLTKDSEGKPIYSLEDNLMSTGAGVFTFGQKADKYGEPMYLMYEGRGNTKGIKVGNNKQITGAPTNQALHSPSVERRNALINDGNPDNNKTTFGCLSPAKGLLTQWTKNGLISVGDTVYVQPKLEENYLFYDPSVGRIVTHYDSTPTSASGKHYSSKYKIKNIKYNKGY